MNICSQRVFGEKRLLMKSIGCIERKPNETEWKWTVHPVILSIRNGRKKIVCSVKRPKRKHNQNYSSNSPCLFCWVVSFLCMCINVFWSIWLCIEMESRGLLHHEHEFRIFGYKVALQLENNQSSLRRSYKQIYADCISFENGPISTSRNRVCTQQERKRVRERERESKKKYAAMTLKKNCKLSI